MSNSRRGKGVHALGPAILSCSFQKHVHITPLGGRGAAPRAAAARCSFDAARA